MISVQCANCGVEFAISDDTFKRRKADGKTFYCPAGHGNVFRPSDTEVLRKQISELKAELIQQQNAADYWESVYKAARHWNEELQEEVKYWRGQATGYKGAWTRLKNSKKEEQDSVEA